MLSETTGNGLQYSESAFEVIYNHNKFPDDCDVSSIKEIEMCHFNYPMIKGLGVFENLRVLTIISQDIQKIEGLETLLNLEKLWICETNVAKITGLDNCTKLHSLYL
jgi:Leucine-rich repeat (LRR) protein